MIGPFIAPKSFWAHSPQEYHDYVKKMYELRKKGSAPKKAAYAEGLALKRTKKGAVSILRNKNKRAFMFVLSSELDALAAGYAMSKAEVWNAFKTKGYVIAQTRMEAEKIHADIRGLPW